MKTEQNGKRNSNNNMGSSTADRGMNNQRDEMKSKGISNAGGQRSDQTSSRDSMHKSEHRKH